MSKEVEYHLDIFKKEIRKGSFVVANWWGRDLQVCVVTKLATKMVQVKRVVSPEKSYRPTKNKYPHEMMVVDPEDVTMYVLSNSNK